MEIRFSDRDEFKRKGIAEKLIKLLRSDSQVSPMVLDGPWGSGKTEFCHKLINLSKDVNAPFQCVYIDSYKFDHSEDPLLMLIGSISALIQNEDQKKDLIKRAIPIAKVLGKVAGKAALSWALRTSADKIGEDLSGAAESEGESTIDAGITKLFEDFEKVGESLTMFKEALEKAASEKPIIVIIDELDRCRPTFALDLLEKVKHVFDVKHVSFIFSTNIEQLCSMVRKQYGPSIDANTYISKFFQFKFELSDQHTPNNFEYFENGFELFWSFIEADSKFKNVNGHSSSVKTFFQYLFKKDKLSLRDAEKFYNNLKIFNALEGEYSIKDNTMWIYVTLMMLGVYIYSFHPDFKQKVMSDNLTTEDIDNFFEKTNEDLIEKSRHDFEVMIYAIFKIDQDTFVESGALSKEQVEEWEKSIYSLFNLGRAPERGRRFDILRKSIRVMHLQ